MTKAVQQVNSHLPYTTPITPGGHRSLKKNGSRTAEEVLSGGRLQLTFLVFILMISVMERIHIKSKWAENTTTTLLIYNQEIIPYNSHIYCCQYMSLCIIVAEILLLSVSQVGFFIPVLPPNSWAGTVDVHQGRVHIHPLKIAAGPVNLLGNTDLRL